MVPPLQYPRKAYMACNINIAISILLEFLKVTQV